MAPVHSDDVTGRSDGGRRGACRLHEPVRRPRAERRRIRGFCGHEARIPQPGAGTYVFFFFF